jgi:hypothetical protein
MDWVDHKRTRKLLIKLHVFDQDVDGDQSLWPSVSFEFGPEKLTGG